MKKTKQIKKQTKTTKKTPTKEYNASIKILGKIYQSKGSNLSDVILNLKPDGKCVGMSILSVSNGSETKEKILNTFQTSKLFSQSPLMRELALKNTILMFSNL